MRNKLLHIIVTICIVLSGVLFLQASKQTFAQTTHTISGTVFIDVNRDGIQNAQEIVPNNTQIKITHNKKDAFVEVTPDGTFTYQTPDSGIFTVSLLFPRQFQTSERYTKSIYLSNTISKATVNFSVVQNPTPPIASSSIQSTTVQNTYSDCDFSQNVTCGNDYFCEDEGTESRWCRYDDSGQWCIDFIDYCAAGQTCTNGHCGGGGGGGETACGNSVDAACCNGSCNDGLNLVCTSLPRGTSADSCQQCGDQGEFCCTNSRCNSGLTCSNYVCQPSVTYSVSGYVYVDKNNNRIVEAGEAYTQPLTLEISSVGSVTTNGGYYSKTLPVQGQFGSYSVALYNPPTNYKVVSQNPAPFQVSTSQPNKIIDIALAPKEQYQVTGYVYIDTNKNKVKDANEVGSGNETVSVTSSTGELNAQTNNTGLYTRILPNPGYYNATLLTRPQFENTTPEIVNFYVDDTNPIKTVNFGIYPKATSPSPTPATPVVKFLKPATDNLTVSGMMEIQATASVSGSTFTSFKICTDVANDCIVADSATVTGRSVITVNVPGGVDTTELTNGSHTLTATAVAANGKTGTATRTIKVQNNTPTLSPTKSPTPTPSKTPTPVPGNSNTPVPESSSTPIPGTSDSPTPSTTPTPGACNNDGFCGFGENVNTCPSDCAARCGDNICSAGENPFSCEADCGDPGTSATPTPTGTGATSTATPTRNPSHTATPTNPIGSTNTPTRNPSHTATPTRNPAHTATPTLPAGQTATPTPSLSPAPQDIILNVSVKLPGIGNKSGDVTNPVNKTIVAAVAVYNSSNQYVKQATGNLTFDGQVFKGPINIGSLPAGSYTTYIKTSNSLIKRLTPTITGGTGGSVNMPQVELVTGDFDQTNKLDIVDYNKLLTCYGKNQQGNILNIFGTNAFTCGLQDLNDDGKVDEKDVNIFLRGFAIREGDKP